MKKKYCAEGVSADETLEELELNERKKLIYILPEDNDGDVP